MNETKKEKRQYDFSPKAEAELKLAGFFFFSMFAGMILALIYLIFRG
ncbi:hypothetical protein DelCs14_2852 [Delftia sp. Cs1-4]|nr:hypothetical protein [Delftia sp. Cs1-4]AEF89864.1 hypothetical protein DelCs14_2852 [Delftia sp. Cs1-4]